MGDSGEGLVDNDARIQELMDARDEDKKKRAGRTVSDPEQARALESLRLARAELARQADTATHPVRRQQLAAALEEIDRRMASLQQTQPA
jgi:hypothetical protein